MHLIIFQFDEGLIFRGVKTHHKVNWFVPQPQFLSFISCSCATSSAPSEVFYIQQHLSVKYFLVFFFPLGLQDLLAVLLPHKVNINSTLQVEFTHGHQIWILCF